MSRLQRMLAASGVVLVLLTGCSSGGGKDKASSTSTTAPSAAATAPSTTVRPVDTSFTGQNSAQFCSLSKTYNDRFATVNPSATPAQLRTAAQEGRAAINDAAAAAPAEIKPDVQVIATAFTGLFTELEKANFDVSKVPPSALTPLQSPEFQASTTRFQAYLRSVCGITG